MELRDGGSGKVTGTKVRQFDVGTWVEGCVADDALGKFYIAEETVAIWKYVAELGDGEARVRVDKTVKGGHLTADIEGLAIYSAADGRGYLLASSQGSNTFVIYERGGTNAYAGTFLIADGVNDTDGIEVRSASFGPAFPKGFSWPRMARTPAPRRTRTTSSCPGRRSPRSSSRPCLWRHPVDERAGRAPWSR